MKKLIPLVLSLTLCAACSQDDQAEVVAEALNAPDQPAASRLNWLAVADQMPPVRAPDAIASAKDQGTLARYPEVAGEQHGAYTWHHTELSESHAVRAVVDGVLDFTTPSGQKLQYKLNDYTLNQNGDWTWVGDLVGAESGHQAVLTFGADAVFGNIAMPDGSEMMITTRAGKVWTVQTDPALAARQAARPRGIDFKVPPEPTEANARVRGLVSPQSATVQAIGEPLVDLVVGYTNGMVTMYGSHAAVNTRLTHLVSLTNQAYANSEIDGRVRIVRAVNVNYTESNDNTTALEHLTGSDGGEQGNVAVPASLQPLHTARENYGGDLVVLLRRFAEPEHNSCGVAWLLGGGKSILSTAYEPYGFAVVSDSNGSENPDGGYFCDDDTFAHELGHNMGNAHDRETSKGEDGVLDDPEDYGRYQYSFGHSTGAGQGNFYTIMTYGQDGQVPYRIFSNPDTNFCGGLACGITNVVDNARSMGHTMPIIADFRDTVVPVATAGVRNDVNGDGNSDILWRQDVTAQKNFRWWPMSGTTRGPTGSDTLSVPHTLQATGDFNGDGIVDLVWRNGEENRVLVWLGTGSGFSRHVVTSYGAGWSVVGTGDVNGDGNSDILWRQDVTGANNFRWWLMDGATRGPTGADSLSVPHTLQATGDFNGDGLVDLVWRNGEDDRVLLWMGTGTGFDRNNILNSYGAGWSVVGAGDVDGDGNSDILWRQDVTAQNNFRWWLMNGTTRGPTGFDTLSVPHTLQSTGDLNGDGFVDLVWRKGEENRVLVWLGNGSGFDRHTLSSYGAGWSVVDPGR